MRIFFGGGEGDGGTNCLNFMWIFLLRKGRRNLSEKHLHYW